MKTKITTGLIILAVIIILFTVVSSAIITIPESAPSDENCDREYLWNYNGSNFTLILSLSKDKYEHYQNLGHSNINMAKYATDKYNRELAGEVADKILENCDGFTGLEKVMTVASFVQSLPYKSDNVTTRYNEYVRYPIETLVDNCGDCEDTAILAAAMLREMGYDVVLLEMSGHVAVGISGCDGFFGSYWTYNGEKYYYLETTAEDYNVGAVPNPHKDKIVFPMNVA